MACNECYDPLCARSLNAAAACNCTDFVRYNRLDDGSYGNDLLGHLPKSASSLPSSLIDAMKKHTNPDLELVPLVPDAVALYNGGNPAVGAAAGETWLTPITGADAQQYPHLLSIYKHYPEERAKILNHLQSIALTGANAGAKVGAKDTFSFCKDHQETLQNRVKDKAKTADEFENARFPLARAWLLITKANNVGDCTFARSGLTAGRFDPLTGDPAKNFEKLMPITSFHIFYSIREDFEMTLYAIGKNGGRKAWAPFWTIIRDLSKNSNDPTMVHELVFETLTAMDTKQADIVSFLNNQWTTFFNCFMTKWRENDADSRSDPTESPIDDDESGIKYREHVKFGEVTKQGEWAGEMRTKNGAIAYCNKWNERKPCTHGVFAGRHKGKCAYCHKCRWCGSAGHRAEDKHPAGHAQAGGWVCPKHK